MSVSLQDGLRLTVTRHSLKERISNPDKPYGYEDGPEIISQLEARYVVYDASPVGRAAKIRIESPMTLELHEALAAGDLPKDGERVKASTVRVTWDRKEVISRRGSKVRRPHVSIDVTPWSPDSFDEDGEDRPVITSEFPCVCGGTKGAFHNECYLEKTIIRERAERQRVRRGQKIEFTTEVTMRFKVRVSGITEQEGREKARALAAKALAPDAGAARQELVDLGTDFQVWGGEGHFFRQTP